MNYLEKYPSLAYLLRCYFNQDFEIIFGSAAETLAAYRSTESAEEQRQMKTEVENLLALSLTEEELQDILLNRMDCSYYYLNEWNSSKEWLMEIHSQVS